MADTRLSLRHRLTVLGITFGVCVAILAWGYVFDMGAIIVEAGPEDVVRVDGREEDDGEIRVHSGERKIRIERPHHEPYETTVRVKRGTTERITPELVFQPYRAEDRPAVFPLVPNNKRADEYSEKPGTLASYPERIPAQLGTLPGAVRAASFSRGWTHVWYLTLQGKEAVFRLEDGATVWEGSSLGRAFDGETLVYVKKVANGNELVRVTFGGADEKLGVLEGEGTFTVVPAKDRTFVLNDVTGGGAILTKDGTERVKVASAILGAKWSPAGDTLLLSERPAGAGAAPVLALWKDGEHTPLDLHAPVELAEFSADGKALYVLERQPLSEDVFRALVSDPRVAALYAKYQQGLLSEQQLEGNIPGELGLATRLLVVTLEDRSVEQLEIDGEAPTTIAKHMEFGEDGKALRFLASDSLMTIRLAGG